jgi:hypothetical protein
MTLTTTLRGMGRGLAAVLAAALLGCSQDTAVPAPAASVFTEPTLTGRPLPPGMRPGGPAIPAAVYAALAQVAGPAPAKGPAGRRASVVLPHHLEANTQYAVPGDAGYIMYSPNVDFSPTGIELAPEGSAFPGNLSYVVYRVDDLTQTAWTLTVNPGTVAPGNWLGVAAYNWGHGAGGRWEPLYYEDVSFGSPNLNLWRAGSDYTNANDDLAFMVFSLQPDTVEVSSFDLSDVAQNPGLDEIEPNDEEFQANALPAFPFSNYTGNVGLNGRYDSDRTDVFWFSAAVGDMLKFTITLDEPNPDLEVYTYWLDPFNPESTIASGVGVRDPVSGQIVVTMLRTVTQEGTMYLSVSTLDGSETSSDYSISAFRVQNYYEVEENDVLAQATPITTPTFFVNGSVGPAGDYDGDSADYFKFDLETGAVPYFLLWYDEAQAAFEANAVIVDSQGDLVYAAQDANDFGIFDLLMFNRDQVPIGPGDIGPFYLILTPGGSSNYWFERFQ